MRMRAGVCMSTPRALLTLCLVCVASAADYTILLLIPFPSFGCLVLMLVLLCCIDWNVYACALAHY